MRLPPPEYHVSVTPDGGWSVSFTEDCFVKSIASGTDKDQVRGELSARRAIEDDKAKRAKERLEVSMVRSFTVPA